MRKTPPDVPILINLPSPACNYMGPAIKLVQMISKTQQVPCAHPISRSSLNFKTNSALINIDQELSMISLCWQPQAGTQDFRTSYQLAVDLVKRFQVVHWLNDARNLAYLNMEDQNWLYRHIVPQMERSDLQRLARIVLDEPLAILVSYNMMDKITQNPRLSSHLQCEIFTSYDEALFWLHAG